MSRTRERYEYGSVSASMWQYFTMPDGTPQVPHLWHLGGNSYSNSKIIDSVTPRYRQRRAAGEIIMNPLELSKHSVQRSDGGLISFSRDNFGSVRLEGDMMGAVAALVSGGPIADSQPGKCSELALVKAYARLNSTPVLSGEIFSDLEKTVSMLRSPFKRGVDHCIKVQGRMLHFRRKGQNYRKAAESAWLEGRYGWIPILSDASEILKQAEKLRSKLTTSVLAVRASEKSMQSTSYDYDVAYIGAAYRAKGTRVTKEETASSSGILYAVNPQTIEERVSRALGLGAQALPATLWEIVPWSFVADWFTNIGPWLEAVTPNPSVRILGSWTTEIINKVTDFPSGTIYRTFVESDTTTTTYSGKLNSYTETFTDVRRYVGPSLPMAPSTKMKPNLSWKQTVDALALFTEPLIRGLQSMRH